MPIHNKEKQVAYQKELGQLNAESEWVGMPEFIQNKKREYQKIIIRFEKKEDIEEFSKLIEQKITAKTKSIWFPKLDRYKNKGVYYS